MHVIDFFIDHHMKIWVLTNFHKKLFNILMNNSHVCPTLVDMFLLKKTIIFHRLKCHIRCHFPIFPINIY